MMPPVFQNIMNQILLNIRITFASIDDVLIITKGTKDQHMTKVENVVKKLDEADIRLKIAKLQNRTNKNRMVEIQFITKWSQTY